MPGQNPKHKKIIDGDKPMGLKHEIGKCSVQDCKEMGAHTMVYQNLEGYLSKLGYKVIVDTDKSKKVVLCKKHFKEYKKLKDKDERYTKFKDFGSKSPPKPEKMKLDI